MPHTSCRHKWCPSVLLSGVWVSSGLNQTLKNFFRPVFWVGSVEEWCPSIFSRDIRISASIKEKLQHSNFILKSNGEDFKNGTHNCRISIFIACIQVSSSLN